MFAYQLVAVIMDFVLSEGPLAFLRTGLVLLKQMKKELIAVNDSLELSVAFESIIREMTDTPKFKRRMKKLFINANLINLCRKQNIDHKQKTYYESMGSQKIRTQEKCTETSPYCHWERNSKFKDFHENSIFRCANLQQSIKFNYFDPFEFINDHKPYHYLKEHFNHLSDDKFSTHSRKDLSLAHFKRPQEDFDSEEESPSGQLEWLVNRRRKSIRQKSFCVPKSDAPKDTLPFKQVTAVEGVKVDCKTYFDNQTAPTEQPKLALTEMKRIENEVVIVRCSHICHFEKFEFELREMNQNSKVNYFLIVNCILSKYIGKRVEEAIGQLKDKRRFSELTLVQQAKRIRRIFNSKRLSRGFLPRSSSEGNDRRGVFGYESTVIGQLDVLGIDEGINKVTFDFGDSDENIVLLKYQNAYLLNEEGLRRDLMRESKGYSEAPV